MLEAGVEGVWVGGRAVPAGASNAFFGAGGGSLDGSLVPMRRMGLVVSVIVACAALAVVAGVPAWGIPPAAISAESGDAAATDAYLTDVDAYEQAALANSAVSLAAVEGAAGSIDAGCAGVLKGVSPERSSGSSTSFARQVGESKREDEQLAELEDEMGQALSLTLERSDRQALLTFAAAVRPLHWSDAALTRLVSA